MIYSDSRVNFYLIEKYGVFHRILKQRNNTKPVPTTRTVQPAVHSTWLRIIVMFWNVKVMKAAFKFGVAALIMNQYERLGFAALLLCFAL